MDSTGLASAQPLQLHSLHFALLGAAAVLLLRLIRGGAVRAVVLLVLNLYFFWWFIDGWQPLALFVGLAAFSYLVGRVRWLRERLPWQTPILAVLLWVFLFLVKDPSLLPWLNPFARNPIILIGVSYMVFRCIHFVMDAEMIDNADFLSFVNYVFFFPTLLAGPIDQYENFLNFSRGDGLSLDESPLPALHRIANGYLKKFVLYENLLGWSFFAGGADDASPLPLLWIKVLLLPVLLYLDFSGYCDIMIGLGRLVGYRLPENFNAPWKAANIQEFWNRWHITLSQFIRDYVFNPLSYMVHAKAPSRWHFPLLMALYLLVMILLGLWHATTLAFLLFGLAHGLMLVLIQVANRFVYPRLPDRANRVLRESRAVFAVGWGFNYLFLSLSISLWYLGVGRFLHVTCQLFGG